ncbi:aminopeptidase [Clostridium tunisiense]|uniref:aminopeptidase n=1 Tax=Clostridium tunisiense TaxID=219748 RepID=UPI0002E29E3B|nr:aminopeptidase [Clostridium tunisiense]
MADKYMELLESIRGIAGKPVEEDKKELIYLKALAGLIVKACEMEEKVKGDYFTSNTFEVLLEENNNLYKEIMGENYNRSYGNPAYAVSVFGEELGRVFTYLYNRFCSMIKLAFNHEVERIEKLNSLYMDIYNSIESNGAKTENLLRLVKNFEKDMLEVEAKARIEDVAVKIEGYVSEIIQKEDLRDIRYLFKYGRYIGENEIKTAEFLANYGKIEEISKTVVNAYINGFTRDNKDYRKKSTVRVIFNVGQELIVKSLMKDFETFGLKCILNTVDSTDPNKQFTYDHRFDGALFLDEEYTKAKEEAYSKALETYKEQLSKYSGPAFFDRFGETPFAPESKKECLKLSETQARLFQSHQGRIRRMMDKYMPDTETSFTIIAFPTPEIGERYEKIFEDTLEINMLDSSKWERIQQNIIDILDKGEYVQVKGKGTNKTDIKVKMHELKNPNKETNFENCVADVNIPVGEVFTSPVLKGTNGILHVEEVYLNDLKFLNLELLFEDGYIKEYNCTNFEGAEENKKYIEENLLFPNKTLPLGEFAIGTNTLAYVIAQKHDIVNILPILIVEKMGPHFAIGDTCFSFAEDVQVYNQLDGKEIIARDNEKSILRKTNIEEAYTQCHTDITLPYDGLEFISVITKEGEVYNIIENGRFVVKGTEELNKPFEMNL